MEFWSLAYRMGWASKEDLQFAVQYKDLTADEYLTITGDTYPTTV